MARYIDADALLENLKNQYGEELGWQGTVNMSDVGMMIEDAPTADVVEVVRCKDCKYNAFQQPNGTIHCHAKRNLICEFRSPDDFCSYGERKDKQ